MKKIIVAMVVFALALFGIAACNNDHVHSFGDFVKTAEEHYKVCECGEESERGAHEFVNDTCSVCGYKKGDKSDVPSQNSYTVTFNTMNGEKADSISVKGGSLVSKPNNPTRQGYNFSGWFKDIDCTEEWKFASDTVSSNITLYAKWEIRIYTVTFKVGDKVIATETYTIEDMGIVIPEVPEQEGYIGEWEEFELDLNSSNIVVKAIYTKQHGEIQYELDTANDTYTIVGYEGNETKIVIPDMNDSKKVTQIAANAFAGKTSIKSVVISDNITKIGESAFAGCTSLQSVTLGEGVTSIWQNAFSDCTSLKSITFGSSLQTIGNGSFINCKSLQTLELPDNLQSVGENAFANCTSLQSVNLGRKVQSIKDRAFFNCYKLIEVNNRAGLALTEGGTSYGYIAFYAKNIYNSNNGELSKMEKTSDGFVFLRVDQTDYLISYESSKTNIVLPDNDGKAYDIYKYAFAGLNFLRSVIISDNVTNIEDAAFERCGSLQSVTIGKNVKSFGNGVFSGCNVLKTVSIGSIEQWLNMDFGNNGANFRSSTELYIGDDKITEITIPDGITSIRNFAFEGCRSLQSVTIGKDVESIGANAFGSCEFLSKVTIDSLTHWLNLELGGEGAGLLKDEMELYIGNEKLINVNVPAEIRKIRAYAFYGCRSIESIVLPDDITSIGKGAFVGTSITSFDFPGSVQSIGTGVFSGCKLLKDIVIPDNITSIGAAMFSGCTSLQSVVLGKDVNNISASAFGECSALKKVYYKGMASQWSRIRIERESNLNLINAERYYYSVNDPKGNSDYKESNHYWCYDDNGQIKIWQ